MNGFELVMDHGRAGDGRQVARRFDVRLQLLHQLMDLPRRRRNVPGVVDPLSASDDDLHVPELPRTLFAATHPAEQQVVHVLDQRQADLTPVLLNAFQAVGEGALVVVDLPDIRHSFLHRRRLLEQRQVRNVGMGVFDPARQLRLAADE